MAAAASGDEQARVSWDSQQQRLRCERELRLGALVLERRNWPDPTLSLGRRAALLEGLAELGLEALPWSTSQPPAPAAALPGPSGAGRALAAATPPWQQIRECWLADQLDEHPGRPQRPSTPQSGGSPLERPGLGGARARWIICSPPPCRSPSGRQAALDYSSGEPVLAVKLQELFGPRTRPTVLDGRLPVTVHLLSPAGRPAAITQDLEGFWSGAYQQVTQGTQGPLSPPSLAR